MSREVKVRLLIPPGGSKQIPGLTLKWFSPCSRAAPLAKIPLKELEQHPRNSHSSWGGSRAARTGIPAGIPSSTGAEELELCCRSACVAERGQGQPVVTPPGVRQLLVVTRETLEAP